MAQMQSTHCQESAQRTAEISAAQEPPHILHIRGICVAGRRREFFRHLRELTNYQVMYRLQPPQTSNMRIKNHSEYKPKLAFKYDTRTQIKKNQNKKKK